MKKIITILLLTIMIQNNQMSAQIILDTIITNHSLGYTFKPVQISSTETKWFFADTSTNTFNLMNMDFTPFLTNISVPEPFAPSSSNMQVLYISRTLFDCDSSNIEFAYYSPLDFNKSFRIVRTDATILFQLDSANGPYFYGSVLGGSDFVRPIVNTSAGAKLFLQKSPAAYKSIYVYSLCGSLQSDVFESEKLTQSFIKAFPNPSTSVLNFIINLPDNFNEYDLMILNENGKEVKREKVNNKKNEYSIDMSGLSSGCYIYALCTKNKCYQSGKFILNK